MIDDNNTTISLYLSGSDPSLVFPTVVRHAGNILCIYLSGSDLSLVSITVVRHAGNILCIYLSGSDLSLLSSTMARHAGNILCIYLSGSDLSLVSSKVDTGQTCTVMLCLFLYLMVNSSDFAIIFEDRFGLT